MESRRNFEWKYKYLSADIKFRDENRPVIYLDETCYDTHDIVKKSWTDGSANSVMDVLLSRGKPIIILPSRTD